MKDLTWKKIGLAAVSVILVIALVFYFTAGKSSKPYSTSINPAFGEYISSFTSGVIGSGSTIRIILAKDAVDSASVGQETSVKLLEFSPSVKGTSQWLDRRTFEFKPSSRLASAQIYEVSFLLSKLFDVPKDLSRFDYSFQVIPQNFELTVYNVKPYVKTELTRQKIEGIMVTADFAEPALAEQVLTAAQEGNSLKVSWTHTGEGKQHLFVVENVARKDSSSIVKILANGKSLGTRQTDERVLDLPALNDFKVMNVRVDQNGNQHVVLQFSDPLNEKQNLQGLISISGLQSLDFEIKDNEILIYPAVRQIGNKTVTLETGIRNILNYKMRASSSFDVAFEQLKPEVRFTGKGSILPSTDGLVMPFEAVNLKSVDIEILKIFENNVLQFLQVNDLDGNYELHRVARPVLKKILSLDNAGIMDIGKWNRFTIDLSKIMNVEPGAIYQVKIGFKKSYAVYICDESESTGSEKELSEAQEEEWSSGENEASNWDSYDEGYYYEGYDWQQRDNPCNNSYYGNSRRIVRNVLASDLGLLAKRGADGDIVILVNDLKSTQPLPGVQLEIFDFQQQLLGSASTGADGKAVVNTKKIPFVLVARSGQQRGYLKLQDGESLSLSNFDIGGEQVKKGLKGYIYGERGVWRPGDSLFLSFILEDKLKILPASHPVVFELQNPQGQVTSRLVKSISENGFYKFVTTTSAEAPTGIWLARIKVGGVEFTQTIRIEMVKPNRLKINLDFGVEKLVAGHNNVSGTLNVSWLQGAPGKNLKAQYEVVLTNAETKFQRYPDYIFTDPSRTFTSEAAPIFDGTTDANGKAMVKANLDVSGAAPGMLNAVFRGKVFEESGNFSIDRFSIPFYPYESFTGIRLPLGDKTRGMLLTDTTHRVDVVTIDPNGNPVSRDIVEMAVYKIEWKWWWDNSSEGDANFMTGDYSKPIQTGKINTVNGKGVWSFRINHPEWGRYFVKATDPVSKHSTGKIVYIDWPGWAGRGRGGNEAATMLSFSSDKPMYSLGGKVNLLIPGSDRGRALISVENGSKVIETFWLETRKGDNAYSFDVTREMTPNIFVHTTLLQPHSQTSNDLPIRLYGVIPIQIENKETHLTPVITMPDVLEPGQEVVIKISEQTKRKMTYTLAVVEEGLLDLTHYQTPDPWSRFYAREALGVKTWDLYNQVIGAFGGRLERLMAVGGDAIAGGKEDDSKTNRFKPVVKFLGPFTLDGSAGEHHFVMPPYVGSVKAMVIAGYDGAYGKAEKAVPVRKPLMVLATLPRVLGPQETMNLPVTLFTTDPNIKQVKVEVKITGSVTLESPATQMVQMSGGNKTIVFSLNVKSETGKVKFETKATSGKYTATDEIEIQIRNPNPSITKVQTAIVETGQTWTAKVSPVGIAGTNSAVLEVSSLPPVNLGQRLRYLLAYPYGCIEQTTSSVFPQLYLDRVKALTDAEKSRIQNNIKSGVERLKLFVTREGGFAYWPGGDESDNWGSIYAGHFLIEADAKGYFVPGDMLKRWKKYQRGKAQTWRKDEASHSSELTEAYRLYTLALAGDPELGSMNRLREEAGLPTSASWMLAAAYIKAGQPEAAKKLITGLSESVPSYQEMSDSYGSDIRDEAIILETLILLNERAKGFELVKIISRALSNPNAWMNTQSIAWCLKAVSAFAGGEQKGQLKFTYSYNDKQISANTELPMAQVALPVAGISEGSLKFTSESKGSLFVKVITEGVPARGAEEDADENLTLGISYADVDGHALDPSHLEQGKEFVASVTVRNPGFRGSYRNLALNQIFPSGWEINNLRLDEAEARLKGDKATYQDIRDDRVYTYFDLNATETKTFRVLLTASYAGTFYLPAVSCEAMYDHAVYSRKRGQIVEVVRALTN